jgi:hypothetical protein
LTALLQTVAHEKFTFCPSVAVLTNYGRVMAISHILYGQYHIWDIFGLGLKTFFLEKTTKWTRD